MYYLFYSANGYTSPNYAVGVGRSPNVTGPYEKVTCQFPRHCGHAFRLTTVLPLTPRTSHASHTQLSPPFFSHVQFGPPILHADDSQGFQGPGHCSVVQTRGGNW
jgi:hypothetical protein